MRNNRIKRSIPTAVLCLTAIAVCGSCRSVRGSDAVTDPVDYVNPYAGNISHLLVPTYPTIHLPNSMLRVYPEREDYTSDLICGLPVAVTSHRGSSAFHLSPTQDETIPGAVIGYTYDREKITPYSYSVYLDQQEIAVSYAPMHRAGVYRIRFDRPGEAKLVVHTGDGSLTAAGNSVSGYQIIDGTPTRIYLYLEAKQPIRHAVNFSDASASESATVVLDFGDRRELNIRYGISLISAAQAEWNLRQEIDGYDVEGIARAGRRAWNEALGRIAVRGDSDDEKRIFYTSLYRTYERMVNISENGRYYSAFDGKVHDDEGIPFYTDDWIWDTYRAAHPLRVLIDPQMQRDVIRSYIRMASQSPEGWMPTFPEITGDSHRMNGNHAVAMIRDAVCKGLDGFDLEAAYDACREAITQKTRLPWKKSPLTELDNICNDTGFFPALKPDQPETCAQVDPFEKRQSIAVLLGDSYDSWCLAQIARSLGKTDDYRRFMSRSLAYRNVYNEATGFFHPRAADGQFIEPFDYRFSGGQGARDYYGENNGWIYRWDVPHDITGLIALMGGRERFIDNLNATFREPLGRSKYDFYSQLPDQTGNVGQFSMANEPCLHIPYLYNYAGQPWMTQKRIRTLLNQWFRNDPMGVPGDEDGGAMSAFVVFSMMGFYPVTPGSPTYNIGSPVFKHVKMKMGEGRFFEIEALNYAPGNKYIQSAMLNGVAWNKPWFAHEEIKNGGTLVLVMGDKANKEWGVDEQYTPPASEKSEQ